MNDFKPKDYRITLPNGQIEFICCQSLQLKQKISKLDNSIPYEFMMLVNDKINYIFQCGQDLYEKIQNLSQENYNLKIIDMQQVYQENIQLKVWNYEKEQEINQLNKLNQETSNAYQELIRKNQQLQTQLGEKNKELEEIQEETNQSLIIGQKTVDEKIKQKNTELTSKEELIQKLNQEITKLNEEIKKLNKEKKDKDDQWQKKYEELESIKKDLNEKNIEYSTNYNNLYNQFTNLQSQYNSLQNQLGTLKKEHADQQQQYSLCYQNLLELNKENQDLNIIVGEKDSKIKDLQNSISTQKTNCDSLKDQLDKITEEYELEKRTHEKQQNRLNGEITDYQQQIIKLNSDIKYQEKENEEKVMKIKELKRQVKELNQKNFENEQIPIQTSFISTYSNGIQIPDYIKWK